MVVFPRSRLLPALLAVGLAACSSSSTPSDTPVEPGDGGGDPGTSGTPGSGGDPNDGGTGRRGASDGGQTVGPGADGGAAGSDAGEAGVDAAPTGPTKRGQIIAGQSLTIVSGTRYWSSYVTAMFYESAPSSSDSSCTTSTAGPCTVYDCALGEPATDAGSLRYAGAGGVHIRGGRIDFDLQTQAGGYTTVSTQEQLFDQGTVLTASADGDEVPAFSNESVAAPGDVTLVRPSLDANYRTEVARSRDLEVEWSGVASGDVRISLATTQQSVRSVSITCTVPGAPGSATIPAAAMQKLMPADGSTVYGTLSLVPPSSTDFMAGDWSIHFEVASGAVAGSFTTTD